MNNRQVFNRFILIFSLLLILTSAWATDDENEEGLGGVKGKISTSDNKPAAMVSILLKGTKKNALSADDGSFIIRNIQPGNYTLEVALIGYEPLSENVTIQANKTIEISLQLQVSDKQLQDVIVKTGSSYKTNIPSSSLRITTPILKLPQNIQEITGKTLKDQQIISMSDGVVRNVSGAVRLEHWADMYTNISARGSQVQAFRNGFNVVNSYWGPLTEDMSFVDHIEFVKGPAGFMLSSGDPSGLYNVVTKKPTGVTKGAAEITVGSYDLYRATLDLDGKLSGDGKLLYRLNLMGQNKGSFRPDEFNNRYSIAPVVSYQVDDKTKLTLEYTLQHAKMSDVGSYYVYATDGYAILPRTATTLPPGLEPTTMDDHSAFLNIQHQFNKDWKLTVQGAYFYYKQIGSSMWPAAVNADGTMQRAVGSWDARSNMTLAQAFVNGEVHTGNVRHRILGGIDIGTKDYIADWGQNFLLDSAGAGLFNTLDPGNRAPSNGYPSFDHDLSTLKQRAEAAGGLQSQRYTSAYIQDELGFFNDVLRVTLAARYTDLSQEVWGTESDKAKHFTPRAGISASIDKFTSVYGLYDQAFMPQAAGGRLTNGGKLEPITGNNVEFGIKRDWASGKWNTTLAVYRILKNNEATVDPNSPNPNNPTYIVVGQKRAQGIEFDLRGKITNGLSLIANYAYTDSKVTKANEGSGLKVGDIVPSYVEHTTNAWLNYQVQGGALKGVGASAGFTWLANRHTEWEVSDKKLPNYFKLDGGLFWQGEKLRITANIFNIMDKYLYSGSYYSWLSAYYWQAEPGRNLRFSVSYNF